MLASMEPVLKEGLEHGYNRTRLVGHPDSTDPDLPTTADWVEYEMSRNQMLSNYSRRFSVHCMMPRRLGWTESACREKPEP